MFSTGCSGTDRILPAWALLIAAPKLPFTQTAVQACTLTVCVLNVLALAAVMMDNSGDGINVGDFLSYEGVARLFKRDQIVLPIWAHLGSFDLWTGRWIAEDAASRRIPQLVMAPILFINMLLGPVGLVSYMPIRSLWSVKAKAE